MFFTVDRLSVSIRVMFFRHRCPMILIYTGVKVVVYFYRSSWDTCFCWCMSSKDSPFCLWQYRYFKSRGHNSGVVGLGLNWQYRSKVYFSAIFFMGSARYFYGLNTYSAILLQKSLFLCHSSFTVQYLTVIFREMLYNHGNFATWGKEIQKSLKKI